MTAPAPGRARLARVGPRRASGAIVACLALGLPALARAEIGVSVTVASDFRYRGYSFSAGRPALSASLTYDHSSGAYFGVTGVGADTTRDGAQALGYLAYAGYAHPMGATGSWDVGVTTTDLREHTWPPYRVRFTEVYAGLTVHSVSAHLFYSPSYLGDGVKTVYFDIDAAHRLNKTLRLVGHAGVLAPLDPTPYSDIRRAQFDVRAGLAARIRAVEFQLAWTNLSPTPDYGANPIRARDRVLVSAAYFF